MWDQGGQPWPQWPLSQQQWMQSFQHQQDPGQVDWAALAQAWIAQKESTGTEPQNIQPNGQDIPGLEPVGQSNHGAFQGDPAFGRLWQPEWGMHGQPPPPPPPEQPWIPPGSGPMDVVNPSEDSNSQDSVEFNSEAHHGVYPQNSHGYGAQPDSYAMAPMAMNQFDYQHGAASSFAPAPTGFHSPYWQGPPQNRRDTRPPGFRDRPRSPIQLPVKQEAPAPLDAVKRRTLPAWIREGLEKMDREKQKKMERERMEKERAKMAKDDGKAHEADGEGDGPRVPRKSKFDSDDEGNDDNDDEEKTSMKKEFSGRSPSPAAEDSEPEMTEEEKEFQLMIITKTLLTEILLEVTNEEIQHVAKESHRKATRGGLGDYGSDESEDDDERSVRGSESSDTDEEELRHRIREKQDAFRRKERETLQLQEKQAQEALLKKKDKDKDREKDSDKKKEKPKAKEKEKGSSVVTEENGKSKKRKESDSYTDSQSDKHSRQDSKASKKGSVKASKRRSDSDSSRSPTPEVSKEKKSKKSKRSRSRSTEKSHKSGKKASRKHKSKSRSRSTSPSRRSRR
uniref:PNN-interacting serine/arginine-rich protein n=1 Tax=Dicentrarchus labrax TaxID=13489 RepID=A0A8P4KG38_DICLA